MENFSNISLVIRLVLTLAVAFYFCFPDKYPSKKYAGNRKRIRLGTGLAFLCLVISIGLNFYSRSLQAETNSLREEIQKIKLSEVSDRMKSKLSDYPESIKNSEWTQACQKMNAMEAMKLTPNLPEETAMLISLTTCSCMMQALQPLPEFKKSEVLISSGKGFADALNEAFGSSTDISSKVQHCTNL